MKRNNPDDDHHEQHNTSGTCVGVFAGLFCSPTTSVARTGTLSGDTFLQSEFDKLTPQEQERIFRDLYGLDDSIGRLESEDPFIISRKLNELENELGLIKSKEEYEQAERYCPTTYLAKTKVMFLRSERFDAKKAARRLVKHWKMKVELFGLDQAMKGTIQQSDLNEADMESLACGGLQILEEKDRAGRTLFWARREFFRYQTRESLLRALWYMFMSELERDEDAQRNGFVAVVYNLGQYPLEYFDRELYSQILKVYKSTPVRVVGYHSCFNDLKLRTINPFILLFMGKEVRARYRTHVGSHTECLFELMTFGIPLNALPVSMDGQFDSAPHFRWIERKRRIELDLSNE